MFPAAFVLIVLPLLIFAVSIIIYFATKKKKD